MKLDKTFATLLIDHRKKYYNQKIVQHWNLSLCKRIQDSLEF